MNTALIDTDIIIDHLRGVSEALAFLNKTVDQYDQITISVITVSEIWAGVQAGEEEKTESLINAFNVLQINQKIARKAGDYRQMYGNSHGVLLPDALIAATAQEHNARLFSHNTKHYPMEEISVSDPF